MELNTSWILIGLPLAFALGWLASRLDLRQLRLENQRTPKAYFRGLNHLLQGEQDAAIDAFIEAVQIDPDTAELHFALGNLFRRRGEYERAVRVHEHLLSRADISQDDRDRAQHALSLDYLKAGLLDRAEEALRQLDGTRFETQAHLALLAIYERSRDWVQAAHMAARLEAGDPGSFAQRRAHYLCEQAQALQLQGQRDAATEQLHQALAVAPQSARPRWMLAQALQENGEHEAAFEALMTLFEQVPAFIPLLAPQLLPFARTLAQAQRAVDCLQTAYANQGTLDILDALVALQNSPLLAPALDAQQSLDTVRDAYLRHLERTPSLVAASRWMASERLEHEQYHPQIQQALDHAALPLTRYRCAACGFEAQRHFWQCPGCQAWDSYPAQRIEDL